ncbi:TonB-linked SusC/RagA family outer membrane protein [Mucilaginibacter gracilis]|uniref:TonB-linked SusC/RagA family outer membrane protein n=1 Tax=Mucilaginibacter gracilis TaxID=423350 RepID=A0A495IVC6_9SPHI|nr:SusC/RagA family TonB-linked outer membrane protein [Mucilaginibacter gracilis]RKR80423.1 TonB-linked SusC/RagA family outer membrane protein [Mucilaginibacter gracilis]
MEIFIRKKNLYLLLLLLLCVSPLMVTAQTELPATINSKLEGQVLDVNTKEPLPGAVISISGTTHSVSTNAEGRFNFVTGQKFPYTLIITFIGYERQEIQASGSPIKILLKQKLNQLNEVVITDGYTTQTKKSYTGSATTINGAENENKPFSSPLAALQGEVAGLNITLTNAQPGATPSVQLRGVGSTALNSNPLYVIDGMILSNPNSVLNGINQDDIESVTVLKDASATAIYGSRGSNGVIVINTKKGKAGKTQVDFSTEAGRTINIPLPAAGQPLNADQFATLFIEGVTNAGNTPAQVAALATNYGLNSGQSNDWQKITHKDGSQQQYNVSVRGGNENTKIFASAGYFTQQATTLNSDLKRITSLFNIDQKISKRIGFTTGINISNNYQNTPVGDVGSWANPVFASEILRPFQLAYNPDGSIASSSSSNIGFPAHYNPLWIAAHDNHGTSETRILFNTTLNWNIWDQLKFSSYVSADYEATQASTFLNPVLGDGSSSNGQATETNTRNYTLLTRNQLDYRYDIPGIKDFYVTAAVGYEAQKANTYTASASGVGFPLTQPTLVVLSDAATATGASSSTSNITFNSIYARLSSNYKNLFSISGSFRRDGSSVFGANNPYGNFWSVGGAWNIDGNDFFKDQRIFSSAKLRLSYGKTGNAQGIGAYSAQPLSSYGSNYTTGNGQNYNTVGNPDLTWESAKKFDIGADIGFFKDRLLFTVDYYRDIIDGLIQSVPISGTTGFNTVPYANIGAMQNTGYELSIKGTAVQTQAFSWISSFNIAVNKNKITQLANGAGANGDYYFQVGYDYHTYYTPLWAGVNPADGTALWYTDDTQTKTTTNYGSAAKEPYKTATPKFFGGFNNTFNYRGITLAVDFYYNFGNYTKDYWSTRFYDGSYYTFNKYQREFTNRWTTPGQITDVPKYIAGGGTQSSSSAYSSRFIYNASFIRLKNATLGYDLKKLNVLKNVTGVSKVYIYARGTNLWTRTYDDRLPYDPETGAVTIPAFRTYTLGLNVGF